MLAHEAKPSRAARSSLAVDDAIRTCIIDGAMRHIGLRAVPDHSMATEWNPTEDLNVSRLCSPHTKDRDERELLGQAEEALGHLRDVDVSERQDAAGCVRHGRQRHRMDRAGEARREGRLVLRQLASLTLLPITTVPDCLRPEYHRRAMSYMFQRALAGCSLIVGACSATPLTTTNSSATAAAFAPRAASGDLEMVGITRSATANHKGLAVWFEVVPGVQMDRIPIRTVMLHFNNTSKAPIRIYLPQSEPFRANISSLVLRASGESFFEPEPRPHGYVVTEIDFPLLAPGEEKSFAQTFSLDPMAPGAGSGIARRKGFESGKSVKIAWTYSNQINRWAGGAQTLDGATKALFDGKDIPHIWTGALSVEATWTAP